MDFIKKLLSNDEIKKVEDIIFDKLNVPSQYFIENIIDYNINNNFDESMDLIVKFLNDFSQNFDDEVEFHDEIPQFKLKVSLIQPITERKYFYLILKQHDDNRQFFVKFNKKISEIDANLFNCIMACLVCNGMVYDYEIDSKIKAFD